MSLPEPMPDRLRVGDIVRFKQPKYYPGEHEVTVAGAGDTVLLEHVGYPVPELDLLLVRRPGATHPPAKDPVNSPDHYTRAREALKGSEVIDIIEAFGLGFRLGNTVKYILRAGHKGDRLEDLKKARWYLEREIKKSEDTK